MKNQWAIVTGATSGFGKAIAEKLASDGMNIILTGRRLERLIEISEKIVASHKVKTKILNYDVSSWSECEKKFGEIVSLAPKIEVLVNNAGLARGTEKIQAGKVTDWEEMIDTNIKGLLYMTRLVVPHMIAKNSGHIVNIGSVTGRWTYPTGGVYSSTKFAVRAISESLRMDLMGTPIRVTNIAPGMAETEFVKVLLHGAEIPETVYQGMTPLTSKDIAESVSWCLSRPKHVNISELLIYPTAQAGVGPGYIHRKP